MRRWYQYQTNALAHLPGYPRLGEWMLQHLINGVWRNVDGPFITPPEQEY